MVVWVLRRIYCWIILNVIVTNGCVSITKDLPLYYIECNCHEWLCEYYERSTVVLYWMLIVTNGCVSIMKDLPLYYIECNCDEWLYEYYEGSTVGLYWVLIVTNGCVSIMKDLPL
jgi:uncharacterized protein YceK